MDEEKKTSSYSRARTWVRTPTIYQMEATECGAASLAMILGYYGCFIGLEQLRVDCGVSRDGCNAKNILAAARKYGMTARGFSKSIDDLLAMPVPCIIHWNFCHFVVFEGVKGNHPYINDPSNGRRKLEWQELEDCFTGIVLTFDKTDSLVPVKRENSLIKYIFQRLSSSKSTILALLLTGLLLVVPGTVIPVFSQFFVDYIIGKGNTNWTTYFLIIMLFTVAFQAVFMWLRAKTLNRLQLKMCLISGSSFLSHMFSLPIQFFSQRMAGDLSRRVEDNNMLNNFITGNLAQAVLEVFVALFFLVILFIYSPILTMVGLTECVISIILTLVYSAQLADISKKEQQDNSKLIGALYSGIAISPTLKASGCENEFISRILGFSAKYSETNQLIGRKQRVVSALPNAVTKISSTAVLIVGGLLVINGEISAGMLVAFAQLLTSFTTPVNSLVGFFQNIKATRATISRVSDIDSYEAIERAEEDANQLSRKLSGSLELKDIKFGYSRLEESFINDFNLSVTPGKIIALVGKSASGKSTISKLISGLVDPWEGEVLYDGKKRLDIPADIFNASVTTVSQEIHIFSGSIKDNLTMWNTTIPEKEIIRACRDACIHEDITRLNGAYDHKLAEGGTNLSGGQRQRIEIASALVMNPTLIVMDEATSALDPIVEKQIMDNIRRRGCSCIIVAHRLSTIRDADEIVVLDHGSIAERGTHKELMKLGGAYSQLISNA